MSLHPSSVLSLAAVLVLTSSGIVHVACEVHLVDSPATAPNAGRVQVWYSNTSEWLDVCVNDWDFADGQVVCKELGYPGTVLVNNGSEYGAGGSNNSTGGFACTGNETSLLSCMSGSINMGQCDDSKTAGVVCAAPGYEGCMVEIDTTSDILLDSTVLNNTVEECIEYATAHRDNTLTLYAAMEGKVCWVLGLKNGQNITDLPGVVDDSMLCDIPCPGNPDQRCGGKNVISVYNVNDSICTDPDFPNGELAVQPTPGFFYFGTVVNFSCNTGFVQEAPYGSQCVMIMNATNGSEPAARVMWSNSTPECIANGDTTTANGGVATGGTTTAKPGTNDGKVDAAFVLSIVNLIILLIIAIAIGLYCCFKRKRDGSPRAEKLPRYTKTDSLEMINDNGDRESTVIAPRPEPAVTLQDLPQYTTVDKPLKRISMEQHPRPNSGFVVDERPKSPRPRSKHSAERAVTLQDLPQYTTVDKPLKRISREQHPRPNSGFVVDEEPKRPRSKHTEPAASKSRNSKSRSQVDTNEEIMGTIMVSPLANQNRNSRSREQGQPMSKNQDEGWHDNEVYDSVETNRGYADTPTTTSSFNN